MSSQSKVAIVTGASRGIGAAIAQRLARDGLNVIVNFAGNAGEAEALVREIEQAGGRAITAQADVSDSAAVARMFDAAEAAYGGVDVLVNNAGIMKLATLADTDDALFDSQVAINLKGTFNTLREAARRLRNGGRIINLSSSVVGLYQPTYAAYAATKAGVEAMTHVLTKELRGRNITVNAVAPGPTATRPVPRRQARGGGRSACQAGAARAPRATGRHRGRRVVPGRARRRVGQWPDLARQRRRDLIQRSEIERDQDGGAFRCAHVPRHRPAGRCLLLYFAPRNAPPS